MHDLDWTIHYCANGVVCMHEGCKKVETGYIPGMCNIHTHGLEKYGHKDFQLVLHYKPETAGYILNTLGMRVKNGEKFKHGDLVENIFLDCPIRLDEYEETGRTVLRVIVPDKYGVFPEQENCMEEYKKQLLHTDMLHNDSRLTS